MKRGRLITIGSFDGVHLGHAALLRQTVEAARKRDIKSLALTFKVPPRMTLDPAEHVSILSTPLEKECLLKSAGINEVRYMDFNKETARIKPFHFFRDLLLRKYEAKGIVVGADFRFGENRSAGALELVRWGLDFDTPVWVISPVRHAGQIISSSKIRHYLKEGKLRAAAGMIGHPYLIGGTVVKGRGMGRKIGFPTANLKITPGKILPRGVFAVRGFIHPSKKPLAGVCNIGVRPTFGGPPALSAEVHFFKRPAPLHGKTIVIELISKIRPEKKFSSVEKLIKQISRDIRFAHKIHQKASKTTLYS